MWHVILIVLIPTIIGIWGLQRDSEKTDEQIRKVQVVFCQAMTVVIPDLDTEFTRRNIRRIMDNINCKGILEGGF